MKTGWVIAGVVVVGGIVYLVMSNNKVIAGTRSQSNVSNGTNFFDLAISAVQGGVSLIGGRPSSSSGNTGRGPGDPPPNTPTWSDINGDGNASGTGNNIFDIGTG